MNNWPEFRMWDPETDVSGHGPHWEKAMAEGRGGLPFYLVGNGTSWEKGLLVRDANGKKAPLAAAEFLTILKKYGGE